jgi:hypothetical protein
VDPGGRRRALRHAGAERVPVRRAGGRHDDARGEAARRADLIRRQSGVELTVDEVLESPHVFIGSVDGLAEKCRELRDASASPAS